MNYIIRWEFGGKVYEACYLGGKNSGEFMLSAEDKVVLKDVRAKIFETLLEIERACNEEGRDRPESMEEGDIKKIIPGLTRPRGEILLIRNAIEPLFEKMFGGNFTARDLLANSYNLGYHINAMVYGYNRALVHSDLLTGLHGGEDSPELQTLSIEGDSGNYLSNLSIFEQADEERKQFFEKVKPFENNRFSRLLLIGEGGAGKTNFLRFVSSPGPNGCFSGVVYLSLSDILNNAASQPIPDENYRSGECAEYIFREMRKRLNQEVSSTKKYFLLLDGFNELVDRSCPRFEVYISKLLKEIRYITKSCRKYISLIVSSRENGISLLPEEMVRCSLSKIEDKRQTMLIESKGLVVSEALRPLLGLPLYFRMFSRIGGEEKFVTKFGLFAALHKNVLSQAADGKNIDDRSRYLFIYCVLLPALARKMESARETTATLADVSDLLREYEHKSGCVARIISEFTGERTSGVTLTATAEEVFGHITSSFELRDIDLGHKGVFAFAHQEIREYFASCDVVNSLRTMKGAYAAGELADSVFEFNLKTSVQQMVASEFGLSCDKSGNAVPFRELFAFHPENAAPRKGMLANKLRAFLINEIRLAYAAFALNDHFMLRVLNTGGVHEVVSSVISFCTEKPGIVKKLSLPGNIMNELFDVMGCEAGYFRKDDLPKSFECIEAARVLLTPGHEKQVMIDHQHAKAMLKAAENIYIGSNGSVTDAENLFHEGLALLRSCADQGYNMSANLLFRFYSSPCMWVSRLCDINMWEAFSVLRKCFDEMTGGYLVQGGIGTELVYMARSLSMLLMKGWVSLDENSKEMALPGEKTLKYVNEILDKTEGQDIKLYEWVRGFHLLLSGTSTNDRKKAVRLLANCRDYDLAQLTALAAFSPYNEEIRIFAGTDIYENAYKVTLERLLKNIAEKNVCMSKTMEEGDDIYYLADVTKLKDIIMNNQSKFEGFKYFEARNAFEKISSAIEKVVPAEEAVEDHKRIMKQLFGNSATLTDDNKTYTI